jgi:hypothetical protein
MRKPRSEWQACLDDPDGTLRDILDTVSAGVGLLTWTKRRGLNYSTVWAWLDQDERRKNAYAQSRITAADALVEEAIALLDQELPRDDAGKIDGALVNQRRAQADIRKWQAGKLRPAVYGESLRVESEGSISIIGALAEARARVGQTYSPDMPALTGVCSSAEGRSPTDV